MKRAEKRDSKAMGAMQGMGGYQQQHGGHPGYGAAAYAQTGISLHESTLMMTPLGCQNASHYYLQQFSRIISPEQSEYTIKLIFLNNCDCMKIKYVNYR